MGIYNCEKTLSESVNCIINQTYTDWELIMCDDCSTDNTYLVASELSKCDKRIKLLKNDSNLTLAPTLNKCIEVSQGEFIARMDADDICDSTRLQKQIDFLTQNEQYAIVSCAMELFDDNGVFRTIVYKQQPTLADFFKSSQFCHAGCLMRKSVLEKLNGYNTSEKFKRVEDYELWVRMYASGYKGYNLCQTLYSMRDDSTASKRRNFSNRVNESRVKKLVYKLAKIPFYKYPLVYVPILKFLTPKFIYNFIHRNKRK